MHLLDIFCCFLYFVFAEAGRTLGVWCRVWCIFYQLVSDPVVFYPVCVVCEVVFTEMWITQHGNQSDQNSEHDPNARRNGSTYKPKDRFWNVTKSVCQAVRFWPYNNIENWRKAASQNSLNSKQNERESIDDLTLSCRSLFNQVLPQCLNDPCKCSNHDGVNWVGDKEGSWRAAYGSRHTSFH